MTATWDPEAPGVLRLPSGRLVRGRGLHRSLPPGPEPEFALYLLGRRPVPVDWESRWLRWPDFRLPADRADARDALRQVWERAERERVEVACAAWPGPHRHRARLPRRPRRRPPAEAVAYVRTHYSPRAVETPWQRRYVKGWV